MTTSELIRRMELLGWKMPDGLSLFQTVVYYGQVSAWLSDQCKLEIIVTAAEAALGAKG